MATGFEAFMGGFNATRDLVKRERAYSAAREQYGEKANDPGLFSALDELEYAGNRDARAERQTRIQERQADRSDRSEVREQATHDFEMSSATDERKKEATLNLIQGLRAARDEGQDLGEAFDALSDTLPGLGVSAEDLPAMREELLKNPEILDQYYEALAPATKAGAASAASAAKASQASEDTIKGLQKLSDVTERLNLLESPEYAEVGASVFGLPTPGGIFGSGGFGSLGSVPGSAAADFVSNLEALKADVRSNAFETLKGGGQITETESKFAADAIARLERTTSYTEFQRELGRARAYIEALQQTAMRRLNGESVPSLNWDDNDKRGSEDDPNYQRTDGSDVQQIYPGFIDPDTGAKFNGGDPGDPDSWIMP